MSPFEQRINLLFPLQNSVSEVIGIHILDFSKKLRTLL